MTDEGVKALLGRLKSDATFRERMLELDAPEARLELARAEGFDVTLDELEAEAALLSDEELAQAVGAGSAACDVFTCSGDDTCGW